MYIPPFWCGVVATVFTEIIAGVTLGIITSIKNKK